MGLMNGQAHGFFVMVQRRSADVHKGILIKQRNRSFLMIAWNNDRNVHGTKHLTDFRLYQAINICKGATCRRQRSAALAIDDPSFFQKNKCRIFPLGQPFHN